MPLGRPRDIISHGSRSPYLRDRAVTNRPISYPVTMDDCMITFDTPTASLRQASYGFRQQGLALVRDLCPQEGAATIKTRVTSALQVNRGVSPAHWEAKARVRHRLESLSSESKDPGMRQRRSGPVVDRSGGRCKMCRLELDS